MTRLVAISLLAASALLAQTNRGSITGTVTDVSKAVVAGATITVTNIGTNEVRKLKSSESGDYTVANLEPVTYRVEVEAPGFKKESVENVKVDTSTVATLNISLTPGSVDTKVTVSAESAMVDTHSGTASSTITERQIQDVPLVNRSVLDLALTLPNVSGDAGTENPALVSVTTCPGCNLSVNGGRPMSTLMIADGTNNTGVSLARTMVSFSPETVQEFTVLTANYSAEYGTSGGGIIITTTKSGTNDLNGTALWYNRNPAFAASPFTQAATNRPVSTLKYNQFSIAAGGPVYIPKVYNGKNKTFWFAAFEPFYRRDHLDQYGLLPTDAMRTGDFSGLVNTPSGWLPQSVVNQFQATAPAAVSATDSTIYDQYNLVGNQFTPITLATGTTYAPFPGNAIPKTMLDSTAQKSLSYIVPASTYYLNSNGLISNIVTPRVLTQNEKRYTVRVDQTISAKNHLYARYTSTPIVKTQFTPISPTTDTAEYSWAKQAMIADTHNISPTMFNDLRLNYTRGRFSNTAAPEYDATTGQNLNSILGLPNLTTGGVPLLNGLFPGSSLGGGGSTATGLGSGGSTSVEDREERYGITDIVYKQTGKMAWKFGVDMSHSLQNVIPLFAALGGSYTFSNIQTNSTGTSTGTGGSPFASYLLGVVNGSVTLRNVEIPYYYRWNSYAGFIQNDWRVRPNLTLNLGIRYNLEMPRTEKYNNQGVFRTDLAQNVQLPTPVTLSDGEVITSTLVPPFVFAGRGGNSKYLTPPDYLNFEPRFGFAWSPKALEKHGVTLRGGTGISHVPVSGSTRLPQPDFGATSAFASTVPSTTANPTYVMRLGENPPILTPQTPAQAISAPTSGMVLNNSLYYQQGIGGFAVSSDYHTPYVQNWDLTISWQANQSTTLEFAYVGAKGTHLFDPHQDLNPKDQNLLNAQNAANLSTTATINDPLGRTNPATGKVLTVQNGSLGSPYLGFSTLYAWYDASANSIRHAAYINVIHRATKGLTFTSNYTYGKSIDDSSSSGGDKNVLTPVGGQVDGQIAFGGTRKGDRSVSTYDQRHLINNTFIYDLPFGVGRKFLSHTWKAVDLFTGGWTTTGILRINSGFPYMPTIADSNQLGDLTHTARPDILTNVPIINPLWSRTCPTGAGCQPYLNPSAFARPALGALGDAPRTLDSVRGPMDQFFDISVQKSFRLGSEKRRLQFRVDALNVLNHPTFRVFPNNAGGTDWGNSAPSTAALTAADYNTWATLNNQPQASTAAGTALLAQINAMVNSQKNAAGVLPVNFFSIAPGPNLYGNQPGNYDITTLQGFKQFRLRQAYNTSFGDLYNAGQPRYIQFGVKLFF
jgi:Carboxypeptidase regulatory-like domain/TonB-dependent Receptor Plug Domain